MHIKMTMEQPSNEENIYQKELDEIAKFVDDYHLSGEDLFTAYKIALGLKDNQVTDEDIRHEILELAKRMNEMMKNGMPVNYITRMIDSKGELENLVVNYHSLVDALRTGEKEKRLLHSIVDEKRTGILSVVDPKTMQEISHMEIPKIEKIDDYLADELAFNIIRLLKKYEGKEIGISFAEH
jgi:hypothetical protein